MDLYEELDAFRKTCKGGDVDLEKLTEAFKKLAPAFLYGGYIKVGQDFRIYIDTVEFYFHSEKDGGFQDTIVYHRNDRYGIANVPYFEPIRFHAHASGFDIAFESKEDQYRASALIRRYSVMDASGKNYIERDGKQIKRDARSTYLYDILNGFGFGKDNDISWVPEISESKEPKQGPRRNVFNMYSNDNKKKWERGEKNLNPWSFSKD